MGKTALIAVDVQNDFLPGGALAAPEGDKIIEPLVRLAEEVDLVVATRDWHPEGHVSFDDDTPNFEDSFPTHCIAETPGAVLAEPIQRVADVIVDKGTDKDKEAFSGFQGVISGEGTPLGEYLENQEVDHVVIGGLVDEFCVKNTVLDALKAGLRVTVSVPASAALSEQGEKEVLNLMRQKSAHISYREPRGNRAPTREEAVIEVIDLIVQESEDADRQDNHDLSEWYTAHLIPWISNYAKAHGDHFIVAYPSFTMGAVEYYEIPEAQVSLETTA